MLAAWIVAAFLRPFSSPGFAAKSADCATQHARDEIAEVGAALFAWIHDATHASSPARFATFAPLCPSGPPADVTRIPPIESGDLRALLVPQYIDDVPQKDPWGHNYDYRLNPDLLTADVFAIRTAGADRRFEGTTYDVRATSGPDDDLVLYSEAWVRDLPRLDPVSRQRTTTEQARTVGAALLSWIIDNASGPTHERSLGEGETIDMTDYAPVTAEELSGHLSDPSLLYVRCVPEVDAWGTPYDYRLNENLLLIHVAAIRSLGSDASPQGDLYSVGTFPADDRPQDILWADGFMAREPDASGSAILLDGFESGELWGYWSCGPGF